ncbi:tetratricopeptide repeat protein [Qipengyuania aquimaris]|uniref:tetratricopeptide repeat protein n=1 Tax=Qipengyuania aquimaris TaxID=255984 RepID=UPI001CD235D9|nr:tetratricopeptide repeat protein [Qipengyuania aquimaris]MCA0904270.1 tetratricopeptide repeat protein [Qipengyuania aquimaris]
MARKPKTELTREEKKSRAEAAEQEALLREVDDAVRQGDMESFMGTYGKPLLGVLIVGLAVFGGYLWWDNRNETATESQSEALVVALDQLEAGNTAAALERLDGVEGEGTPAISAKMLRAGLAAEDGNAEEAAKLFGEVAANEGAPQTLRDIALIRQVTVQFDSMAPAEVVAKLQPLATPGEPFFATAGELVAHAYLKQGKRAEAGALFGQIARDDATPEGTRARVLNMAGVLGVDAVDDVEELLDSQRVDNQSDATSE